MNTRSPHTPRRRRNHVPGFTLIELLVVIAIIAVLVSILLPSLSGARKEARAIQCASNVRQVNVGVLTYSTDSKQYLPPSYVYAADVEGTYWNVADQQDRNPNPGNPYIHWSSSLMSTGGSTGLPEGAFQCPEAYNRGAPATNPGPKSENYEPDMSTETGGSMSSPTSSPEDRQVKRMAYTGNAALFCRNKFNGSGARKNRLTTTNGVDGSARGPSKTIMVTEFLSTPNWKGLRSFGDNFMKSHRPITPFIGGSAGLDVYQEGEAGSVPRFNYPDPNDIQRSDALAGLQGLLDDASPSTPSFLNAVGRSHPGNSSKGASYGGSANFVYVDGHVDRRHVLDTMSNGNYLWGDRFWTLTGRNNTVYIPAK